MSDPKKLEAMAKGIAELEPILNPGSSGVIEVGDLLPQQAISVTQTPLGTSVAVAEPTTLTAKMSTVVEPVNEHIKK